MIRLLRELIFLTLLLIFTIFALLINLSFFSDESSVKATEGKEILVDKPLKPIQNQLGMQLFRNNCAACHNRNMRDGLIGPALGGVRERWIGNEANIYDFVRNSQVVIKSGNAYAKDLFEKWKPNIMPPFSNIKDEEIDAILDYIDEQFSR
jgi:mono/diheme cytochrome c family protein